MDRGQVREAFGTRGEEHVCDLTEIGWPEQARGRDRQKRRVNVAGVLEPVNLPAPDTASPGETSTVSPSIVQVVVPFSP